MITLLCVLSCPALWYQGLGSNNFQVRNFCTNWFIAQGAVIRSIGVRDPEVRHRIDYINSMVPPYRKPVVEVPDDEP